MDDPPHPDWPTFHFSQANPAGDGQSDVAALLRRVAKSVEELGSAHIQDITFHQDLEDSGWRPTMTVYYSRPALS